MTHEQIAVQVLSGVIHSGNETCIHDLNIVKVTILVVLMKVYRKGRSRPCRFDEGLAESCIVKKYYSTTNYDVFYLMCRMLYELY